MRLKINEQMLMKIALTNTQTFGTIFEQQYTGDLKIILHFIALGV